MTEKKFKHPKALRDYWAAQQRQQRNRPNKKKENTFNSVLKVLRSRYEFPDDVVDMAMNLFKSYTGRGVSTFNVAVASFIFVIRTTQCIPLVTSIVYYELLKLKKYEVKSINRIIRRLYKEEHGWSKLCYRKPDMFIKFFCEQLKLSKRTMGFAMRLAKKVSDDRLFQGKGIKSIVSAILYVSILECGENVSEDKKITQADVAVALKITPATIRLHYPASLKLTLTYALFPVNKESVGER